MSKYCGTCGFENEDNALNCGNCGTPFEHLGTVEPGKIAGIDYSSPEKKEKNKKMIKLVGGAIVAVIVLVIALKIVSAFTGYKGTVRRIMNAYEKYDVEALVDLTSDLVMLDGNNEMAEYRYEYKLTQDLDRFDEGMEGKYNLSYEITKAVKLSDRQTQKVLEELSYSGLIAKEDAEAVKKIMAADVAVTAKQGKRTLKQTLNLYLVKESGGWKLLSIE